MTAYRIVTEETYQELVNLAKAIANHLENQEEKGEEVAAEFKEIAERAWNLNDDMNAGFHKSNLLPPKLPEGTTSVVKQIEESAPTPEIMEMAIEAFPGIIVVPPRNTRHGYTIWSLVSAYKVTNQCENYKGQWVLRRGGDNEVGANHWGYRITDQELIKRKGEQFRAIIKRSNGRS